MTNNENMRMSGTDPFQVVSGRKYTNNTSVPGCQFDYRFDEMGNRRCTTNEAPFTPAITLYTANLLNQYTAIGAFTPVYDADGNLTNDGTWTNTWDAENRLIKMEKADRKLQFGYDAQGRRVRKQVFYGSRDNWTQTSDQGFVYDGWNLVAILDSQSSILQSFVWGLDLSGSLQGAGGVGGLLWLNDTSTLNNQPSTHFTCYDGNGNVMALAAASTGTKSASYEYGPFGELLSMSGDAISSVNPFRFSTKYQDDETDLLYYGYRYLRDGNWPNRDPIGEEGGNNLYNFVGNDPIRRIDSLGLLFWGCSRNPCADPCGDAKKKGLDQGDVAGIVCCGGKAYTCVWKSGGSFGANNKKAKEVIDKCSKLHEDTHLPDMVPCPSTGGFTRGGTPPGKSKASECSAYKAEAACLNASIADCGSDPQCIAQVSKEIESANRAIKEFCP